jgi:hypothetical protein
MVLLLTAFHSARIVFGLSDGVSLLLVLVVVGLSVLSPPAKWRRRAWLYWNLVIVIGWYFFEFKLPDLLSEIVEPRVSSPVGLLFFGTCIILARKWCFRIAAIDERST